MKFIGFAILLLLVYLSVHAQNNIQFVCYYGETSKPDLACMQAQRSFKSASDAEDALRKIMRPLGLAPNFVMVPCNNINNCAAVTLQDGFRYIVYDNDFMNTIAASAASNWTNISILAHEIGHHLQGHVMKGGTLSQCRDMELEADHFSGFILRKLHATLADAQAALNALAASPTDNDDTYSDHPSKQKRLQAVKDGYDEANDAQVFAPASLPANMEKSRGIGLASNDVVISVTKPNLATSWANGFRCRRLWFGNGIYYAFMTKGDSGAYQQYTTDEQFPAKAIKDGWNISTGTVITSLSFFNGVWNLMMTTESDKHIDQTYITNSSFPDTEIKDKWNQGYRITEAAYGQDQWVIIMNKPENYAPMTEQFYQTYTYFPENEIKENWDKSYYITLLEYLDGKWLLVMSQYTGRTKDNFMQRWNSNSEFPMDKIIENDSQGFLFLSVTYGDGKWVTVMNAAK